MKIFLRQIPATGLNFDETLSVKDLDLPGDLCKIEGPLAVHGDVERVGDELMMKFEVRGRYALSCARCLEEFSTERTDRFDLVFDIEPSTEFIDYTKDFRDELILTFPFSPHCREDCRGICPGCGVNLNKEKCKCINGDKEKRR